MDEQSAGEDEETEGKSEESWEGCYDPKIFIDKSSIEKVLCFLCQRVAKDTVVLCCPQHEDDDISALFCKLCLEKEISSSKTCPIGQHGSPTFERSVYAQKQIENRKVKCSRGVEQIKTAHTLMFSSFAIPSPPSNTPLHKKKKNVLETGHQSTHTSD